MITKQLTTELDLTNLLKDDIESTNKNTIKIFAGHCPLLYYDEGPGDNLALLGVNRWGNFSTYSFEFGCRIARHSIDNGKNANLIVIVDDLVEIPREDDGSRRIKHWMKSAQRRFYSQNDLPEEYIKILKTYGLEDSVLSQQRSFGSSKLISEAKLKSNAIKSGMSSPNECSLAYNAFLKDANLFNANTDYLVSFIPGQCKGNICAGVLDLRTDLDASHVFFPHIELLGGIFDSGKGFTKIGSTATIDEMFQSGITYRKA